MELLELPNVHYMRPLLASVGAAAVVYAKMHGIYLNVQVHPTNQNRLCERRQLTGHNGSCKSCGACKGKRFAM